MDFNLVDYVSLGLMGLWILIEWIIKLLEIIRDARDA